MTIKFRYDNCLRISVNFKTDIKNQVVSKMEITAEDGKNYKTELYNKYLEENDKIINKITKVLERKIINQKRVISLNIDYTSSI